MTPDGFVGFDAEGDHEAWEFQRDIGLVADLLPVGCGGLLEVLGAVYSPSLAREEYSGEMSKELPARGLVPPEKPRVVKAGEAEVRVIPGARPGTAVFVVARGNEFTLLALEEGRWVMGDGWSRGVVRGLGGSAVDKEGPLSKIKGRREVFDLAKQFPQSVVDDAWYRSGGRCECSRTSCGHKVPCRRKLWRASRGKDTKLGWEAHHKNSNGAEVLSNCEILCQVCHKNTQSYGRN